jgi:hypothetical protein
MVLTSLGLWAGLLPATNAQIQPAPVSVSPPAAASPDMPARINYDAGFAGYARDEATTPLTTWWAEARDGEGPVSIVTFKSPDQKNLDETAEDLNILSLIFSKHLERALGEEGGENGEYKLGIPMLLQTGGRWVEASYIEGFGAVLNLKVRFPLMPPAAAGKDAQPSQQDSEWEQARRALAGGAATDARRQNPYERARRFSPNLVETLKKRVIELLRNASNLRHVQPDEWVAVTFAGPPSVVAQPTGGIVGSGSGGIVAAGSASIEPQPDAPADPSQSSLKPPESANTFGSQTALAGPNAGPKNGQHAIPRTAERATVMTIRVKKRDADAFAANKMNEDQFFHAAEIASYLGPVIVNRGATDYLLMSK